jgi:hypothetical protein
MTSRTCESAASCFAQPPLASPRRIFSTPVFFPCAWSRRHLGLRAARALRHRESQRVERAGFGLRHGRLRAHHSAYTPLPERGIATVVFNCKAVVKSFKQFRALPNWFVLSRLCGCSASRAWLGTKAHFGDDREVGPHPTSRCTLAQLYFALANFKSQLTYYEP